MGAIDEGEFKAWSQTSLVDNLHFQILDYAVVKLNMTFIKVGRAGIVTMYTILLLIFGGILNDTSGSSSSLKKIDLSWLDVAYCYCIYNK